MDDNTTLESLVDCFRTNNWWASLEQDDPKTPGGGAPPTDRQRVIAVVGAGGSANVGLPLGKNAAEELRKAMKVDPDELDEDLRDLTRVYNLNRNEFETILLALGSTPGRGRKLRRLIQDTFDHRYAPLLTYEILAHLLKHRFVDAIINFNFDELLDQSIADELDPDEYHRIISDGDCGPALEEFKRGGLSRPIYIKPHGTASHESSLRFTREAYHGLPRDIVEVIDRLIRPGNHDRPTHAITLFVIGFAMQSFEFCELANGAKQSSKVFYFDLDRPSPKPPFQSHLDINSRLIKITDKRSLDGAMNELWTCLRNKCNNKARDIHRHTLISTLLGRQVNGDYSETDYLHDRFLVELSLSIAKGKGLVSMQDLSTDRCGRYFERWLNHGDVKKDTLFNYCEQFGLVSTAYAREAFRLRTSDSQNYGVVCRETFESEGIESMRATLVERLSPTVQRRLSENTGLFVQTLSSLYRQREVEIRSRFDTVCKSIYMDPIQIRTETALDRHTSLLLKNEKWRWILFVAETGEWLLDPEVVMLLRDRVQKLRNNGKEGGLRLVVADSTHVKTLQEAFGSGIEIREIKWWSHNRHMTLLIDHGKNPFDAIYFERRLRALSVCPVRLKGEDAAPLLNSFVAYWNLSKKIDWKEDSVEQVISQFLSGLDAKKKSSGQIPLRQKSKKTDQDQASA